MIAERMSRLKLVPKHGYLGIFDCDCACAAAPNTQAVADASRESAQIMADLGREQLAESRRQYDLNRGVTDRVVNTQIGLMDQAKQQGDDYFEYGKSFRDLEQLMKTDARGGTATQKAAERNAMQSKQTGQANELLGMANNYATDAATRAAQLESTGLNNANTLRNQANTFQSEQRNKNTRIEDTTSENAAELRGRTSEFESDQRNRNAILESAANQNAAELRGRTNAFESDQNNRNARLESTASENAAELRGRTSAFDDEARRDIALATGGNSAIASRFQSDIQNEIGQAVADSRAGQTNALNAAARQAIRYGLSVPANMDSLTAQNAMAQAAAANNTRNASIDRYRGLIMDGIGLKSNNFGQTQNALTQAMDRQQQGMQQGITNAANTFQTGQNATMQAMDRQQQGMQQGITNSSNAFQTGQNATMQAMDRQQQGMQQGFANNANTFQTGQNASMQAMDRQQGAMSDRLRTNRDNFVTTTAAKADAFNRQNQADGTARNQRIQDESLDWARRLDVTGMARGLPGASQGSYQVSIGAGNSAVSNNAQAGNSYLAAINQGVNTIGQGQQMNLQGLSNVLNAQTSFANAQNQLMANMGGSGLGDIGSALGGAASLYSAFGASDRRLKKEIKKVGKDEETGLNEYEFKYKGGKKKYRGVMADEVEDVDPAAVREMPSGYKAVDYARLGIEMKEVK